MTSDLRLLVETSRPGTEQVARKKRLVYETVLRESAHLDGGNFTVIDTTDLQRLFDEYDRHCFESKIGTTLCDMPIRFRLSQRMTRAAGSTASHS